MALHARLTVAFLDARQGVSAGHRRQEQQDLAHDNVGPNLNIAVWILTGAALIFMSLRLYCKLSIRKGLWWDDYVLIAASVALVAQTSMLSVCVHYGFGKHTWDIADWPTYLFVSNITGVCSITAAAWSKTSFAITLLRFTDRRKRFFVWFIIVTVNVFLGLSAIFIYAQCTPIKRLWDSSVEGSCWPSSVIVSYNTFSSVWSGVMDICLALLPWTIIQKLSLNRKERLGVLVAMSMGVFAGLTSIAKSGTLSGISSPDAIATISLMILATAEIAVTIIAASIPALRVLLKNSMRTYSVPRLYHYYRSQDTPTSQKGSSVRGNVSKPTPIRTSDAKNSSFSDSIQMSSPVSSPDSTAKAVWPGTPERSLLDSRLGSDLELQAREGGGLRPATYHKR